MDGTLDLYHGLRLARGGVEPSSLSDENVIVRRTVQDHDGHLDATDKRLGVELIAEQPPIGKRRRAQLEQTQD